MSSYFENTDREIYTSYHTSAHSFSSHFHSKLEIAHCFSGMQKIKLGKELYTIRGGDTLIIFPNTIHEYIADGYPSADTECISLICNPGLMTGYLADLTVREPESPLIESGSLSENAILAFRKMTAPKDILELMGWSYIALSGIMDVLKLKPTKKLNSRKLAPEIISYINDNFQKPLTISVLAREFGYNQSYIAHLFCDKLKLPFRTYLSSLRSEYVAKMIKSTDKSLTEIAYDAGFESLNTFCRCFKKHFGKTPSQYKRDCRA